MRKLSSTEMLQRKKSLADVKKLERHAIVLVLENIRSAYNVGAIFRTADATLVEKIILVGVTPTPPSTHIDKAALGATDVVPWERFDTSSEAIDALRKKNFHIVALEQTDSSISYFDVANPQKNSRAPQMLNFPLALVVGNEVEGVSQKTLDFCDYSLDIPMYGRASSLNVATATGIMLYDILRHLKAQSAQNLT